MGWCYNVSACHSAPVRLWKSIVICRCSLVTDFCPETISAGDQTFNCASRIYGAACTVGGCAAGYERVDATAECDSTGAWSGYDTCTGMLYRFLCYL